MKGFLTYAPLFKYLKVHEISHEKFMEDMGFDVSMMDLLISNGSIATDILQNICTFYGLPLNMVVTMDYELPTWKLLANYKDRKTLPTLKKFIETPTVYLPKEIFRINEIRFMDENTGENLLGMMLEPRVDEDPEAFFESLETLHFQYNPARLESFFKTFLTKNPNFIKGCSKIRVTQIYWLLEPVERDPIENVTNLSYSHGVFAIVCDTSKLKAANESKKKEKEK